MSQNKKIEERGGVLIIFFVALLAIMKVINGSFEKKIVNANNNEVSYSDWYNAKSIKQIMKESERDHLSALLSAGVFDKDKSSKVKEKIEDTKSLIYKYEAEKTEILMGSANIPPSAWVQDLDGEMGKIVGLREWRDISRQLTETVAKIDLGILFLQISLVFGVVGLIIHENPRLQNMFTWLMIGSGFMGIALSLYGYVLSL
ncbi:DUF4337 family protein [Pseudozobellia thermophila]|uniref:DUF4337 domain-containing protein n=1 Tax=Pseudozobellia thermophila TaxID=192903 RepID=A0A1M6FEA9_9FLAO|nr:DUF4337 family protein [Pseudozobellia thermophila]SHI95985.1 protein of unknown function [Pseudozobellia thermophila]